MFGLRGFFRRYAYGLLLLWMAAAWMGFSIFCYFTDENDVEIFYGKLSNRVFPITVSCDCRFDGVSDKPYFEIASFVHKGFKKESAKAEALQKEKEEQERLKKEQERQAKLQKEREQQAHQAALAASLPQICQNDRVADSWVRAVNEQLRVIPKALLDQFQAQGWRMYCTADNIDAVHFGGQFGSVMGVTVYDEKVIYIEDRQSAVAESPVHEFGHYLDYSLGFISHQSEFSNIFSAEQATFRSAYGVPSYFNNEELFAEAFWRYLTSNRDRFRANVPQLCAFFERIVG